MTQLIAPLFESTLLQTSWRGAAYPPLLVRFLAEHPYLNHRFFEHQISRENAEEIYDSIDCTPDGIITSSHIVEGGCLPSNPPLLVRFLAEV